MRALPPLHGLRAFESAARHLSFKAAAAELGVTPTAISHQVRSLEQHCGQPLFRRRPPPLALTHAGAHLFPVLRDGLDQFAAAVSQVRAAPNGTRLRVTTTSAFAARWLVPRLPLWRRQHPAVGLDIAGTDAVLDLAAGEADVALRYTRLRPAEGAAVALTSDRFDVVGTPGLAGTLPRPMPPEVLLRLPLLACDWLADDPYPPTWSQWVRLAAARHGGPVPEYRIAHQFRDESHMIAAVMAGHGIALCSDLLVGEALHDSALLRLSDINLPGYGLYFVPSPRMARQRETQALLAWMSAQLE